MNSQMGFVTNLEYIVVFDLDKTITQEDFHCVVLNKWSSDSFFRRIAVHLVRSLIALFPIRAIRRRFEYFPLVFLNKKDVHASCLSILQDENNLYMNVFRRLKRYKAKGYRIILVSAGPTRTTKVFAEFCGIEYYATKTILGIISFDLLGKKSRIYKLILRNTNSTIRTVYSDSHHDFHAGAKNIQVKDGVMKVAAHV